VCSGPRSAARVRVREWERGTGPPR
jgi:hypothetical protein